MFDTAARRSNAAVALLLGLRDAALGSALALDVHAPAGSGQALFALGTRVAAIGVHVAAGVGGVEERFKDGGFGDGGMGDGQVADQLAALVDTCVQLVAEVVFSVLFGSARIDILLSSLMWLPCQRHGALFNSLGFFAFFRWTGDCTSEASMISP